MKCEIFRIGKKRFPRFIIAIQPQKKVYDGKRFVVDKVGDAKAAQVFANRTLAAHIAKNLNLKGETK